MGKSKGNRAKKADAAAPPSSPPGRRSDEGRAFSPVLVPRLSGPSFEAAVVGSASGAAANGPARIYLSPTLMMAEAIGTGDLLAVAVLRSDGEPTNLTALNLHSNGSGSDNHGEYFALAEAWPSPKLPRDATRLSGPLSESLFNPPGGSLLRIYPLERNQTHCTTSHSNLEGAKQQKSVSKATPTSTQASSRAIAHIRPCSHLELRWCPPNESIHTDTLPLPLSPLTPPNKNSTPQRSTPDRSGTNSSLQPPPSPRTPNPQTPRGRRLSQASPSTPEGHRNPLRGVPASPSLSPLKREEEDRSPPEMTEGQRAAVRVLLAEGKGKKVIETFAARWLAGRYLVEGNFVSIPLCGFNCTFQVLRPTSSDETAPSITRGSEPTFSFQPIPQTPAPTTREPPLVAISVVGATTVSLLEPAESEPSENHAQSFEQEGVEETGTAEGGASPEVEKVGYSELGGVGDQIKALKELVELPLRRPDMFRRYGIRPPRGVLLYGPPGTGKTLLARAAASESGASMFVINGPEIVSANYGESEEALRDVFTAAEKAAPSVIFIDELDAIAPARDTGTEDMAQRMVAALLTLLDGGPGDSNRVIVIAATNRPESIDPALRRPGRFDRELEIGVPTPKGRLEILHTLLRSKRHSLQVSDVNALAAVTHGFVGADLAALCNEAALNALRRIVHARAQNADVGSAERIESGSRQDSASGGSRGDQYSAKKTKEGEPAFRKESAENGFGREQKETEASTAEDSGSVSGATSSGRLDGRAGGSSVDLETVLTEKLSSLALGERGRDTLSEPLDERPVSTSPSSLAPLNPSDPAEFPNPPSTSAASNSFSTQSPPNSANPAKAPNPPSPPNPASHPNPPNLPNSNIVNPNPPKLLNSDSPNLPTPNPPCITLADFEAAQTRVRPSAMREVMIEVPRVRWGDIGGQEATKQKLQETVEWPQKHPEAFTRVGAQAPRGVLLYGPPGCSKTLMARAVATEAGLNFIAVKGPELFSKWVGESEKAVRALFARARASAPSVIFFDEIDGLAATRDDGSADGGTGVSERVMSQLLTEMDGLSPLAGVAIIGATNRPDIIDPALLRPGRFDRMLFVGPPNQSVREQIFGISLRGTPCDSDVRIADLAERTEKYTGADIAAVCREAALAALEEDLSATGVAQRHFEAALKTVGPSISQHDEAFYTSFRRG